MRDIQSDVRDAYRLLHKVSSAEQHQRQTRIIKGNKKKQGINDLDIEYIQNNNKK